MSFCLFYSFLHLSPYFLILFAVLYFLAPLLSTNSLPPAPHNAAIISYPTITLSPAHRVLYYYYSIQPFHISVIYSLMFFLLNVYNCQRHFSTRQISISSVGCSLTSLYHQHSFFPIRFLTDDDDDGS